jgi:hypothetical protein
VTFIPPPGDPTSGGAATDIDTDTQTTELADPPRASYLDIDGRLFIAPDLPGDPDTRPLWLAIMFGLAAGVVLTSVAGIVTSNLHRED